jgi:hypothetical protein
VRRETAKKTGAPTCHSEHAETEFAENSLAPNSFKVNSRLRF